MINKISTVGFILILSSTLLLADRALPSGMADVVGRAMNTDASSWYAKFGHIALYDANKGNVLEVTNRRPAIREQSITTMTQHGYYWGARYGIGDSGERYRTLYYGNAQRRYSPKYTFSPYYQEGKWSKKWRFSWRKGWYRKWVREDARFRCDSFVNYCYRKSTARRLIRHTWETTPHRIFKALPYTRQ